MVEYPAIPENITVHIGEPTSGGENITLPFVDYIKNVASGEIYPTWPEQALRANIIAQTSFALNRVYTEWYPAQGYDFDITSTTRFDQSFDPDRQVFGNISALVDELFNDYLVQRGSVAPYFAQYCNGTTTVCNGLSQWGSVSLANDGLAALDILRYYFGEVDLIEDAETEENLPSFAGIPLALGSAGEDVRTVQRELNRIAVNFPGIPMIEVGAGIYDAQTAAAVTIFQQIFDLPATGVVDKATWYSLKRRYVAVKRLGELLSEGLSYSEAARLYPRVLRQGDSGSEVRVLQYYLKFLAFFDKELRDLAVDGIFGEDTAEAIRVFEAKYGLPVDGIADRDLWSALTVQYNILLNTLPEEYQQYAGQLYPGAFLTLGSSGRSVLVLQQNINRIAATDSRVPVVEVTGLYEQDTADAVSVLQSQTGLPPTGAVGPVTWQEIISRGNNMD